MENPTQGQKFVPRVTRFIISMAIVYNTGNTCHIHSNMLFVLL